MKDKKFPVKLTNLGHLLETRVHGEGKILYFTQVVVSDIILDEDFDVKTLETVENVKMSLPIVDCRVHEKDDERVAYLEAALQNYTLAEGFRMRLIGVYARDPDYPDDRSKDILYCVVHFPRTTIIEDRPDGSTIEYTKETGPWMPTINDEKIVDILYGLFIVIGQAENVECYMLDDVVHITIHTFREHIDHPVPHPNMPHLVNPEVEEFDRVLVKLADEQNFHPSTLANTIRVLAPNIANALTATGDATVNFSGNKNKPNGNINLAFSDLLAKRLKNSITLSLSGNASGSVTTNWGSNATINVTNSYASNAGNANYATSAGSANYATNAGNASYADNAGKLGGKTYSDIVNLIESSSGGDSELEATFGSGYFKIGDGDDTFVIQYGTQNLSGYNVTFPISFPNACVAFVGIDGGVETGSEHTFICSSSPSKTGVAAGAWNLETKTWNPSVRLSWIAVGY